MFRHLPSSFAWLAAFFAALGTLFFVIGAHTAYRNWQFAGNVMRTHGLITGKHTYVTHGRRSSTTHYIVSYRYFDSEGIAFVTQASVVRATYYQTGNSGPIPIKYLPGAHALNRIDLPPEDHHYTSTAWMFSLLGGGFGGAGWYAFVAMERLVFYRRWLRKNGVRCAGRVERVVATTTSVNNRPVCYLVYSYTDGLGRTHEDSSEGMTAAEDAAWSRGDTAEVFCDPRDSSRSTIQLHKR